jgi:hypothetical protein
VQPPQQQQQQQQHQGQGLLDTKTLLLHQQERNFQENLRSMATGGIGGGMAPLFSTISPPPALSHPQQQQQQQFPHHPFFRNSIHFFCLFLHYGGKQKVSQNGLSHFFANENVYKKMCLFIRYPVLIF